MALVLKTNPDLVGHAAFIATCACSPETFDAGLGFHRVVVHGVTIRLSADLEYIVEQDLFVSKATADMATRKAMTVATYRVRAAYNAKRVESQVGRRRLNVYRKLRGDDTAVVFFAKSRSSGGKTPPPVMAISIIRYYIHAIGATALGLDKFPAFMELIDGIELLPNCALDEALRGKWMRHLSADEEEEEDEETPVDDEETSEPQTIENLTRQLAAVKAQLAKAKQKYKVLHRQVLNAKPSSTLEPETARIEELKTELLEKQVAFEQRILNFLNEPRAVI